MFKFKSLQKKPLTSLRARLSNATAAARFRNDEAGIAAIEFAFIAPVMLFMYFGMAEVATAISVDRNVSHSANVAGDLATQSQTISAAEMTEIMTATMLVMGIPEDKYNSVDTRILSSTSGVVVARVSYLYEPLKLRYMPTDFNLRETFMLKPRKSANVDFEETSGGTTSNKFSCDKPLSKRLFLYL